MNTTSEATRPTALPFTRGDIEQTVPARFEQVALRFADCVALIGNGRRQTYHELNCRANQIAHAIGSKLGPGVGCVAYLVDHSPEMVACTLAILKAGKIYLAVHPALPAAAQRAIVRDARPELMLTTGANEQRAREITKTLECPVVTLEAIDDQAPAGNPPGTTKPDDLSTVFYTSGTTGQSKGVVKSHRAVLHRIWLAGQLDKVAPSDRQSLLTYCSFAASEVDLMGALLYGATLCLFDIASRGLAELGDWIDAERITLLHPPALLFRRFLSTLESEALFPSVRLVALAGDVVLPSDIEKWRRHFSNGCAITHRFSTTETALVAVDYIGHYDTPPGDVVVAGRPVADKCLLLLDENGRPVSPGETGELAVSSPYIAQGYWRRPEETEAAFRPDPERPGSRVYRTGDLGRFLDDGRFVFLGRRDHQIKIRGYRVETREIEAALLQLREVRETAVLAQRDSDEPRLVAFVVLQPGTSWDARALRERLRTLLPEWKIPARFRTLAVLPTTLTGKIDRQRLLSELRESETVAPPNAAIEGTVEHELAQIWKTVLEREAVDLNDRFADVGGSSLSAMMVLSRIERRYGIRMAPDDFTQIGTLRQLAEHIRRECGAAPAVGRQPAAHARLTGGTSVVPLQLLGSKPPLYFIHGKGGEVHQFERLAEHLAPDQPSYGLRAAGLDGEQPRHTSVEEMAAHYVREICALQPQGPYYLCGYSMGGMNAFETARQLSLAGKQVGLLALLDTWATNLPWPVFFRTKGRYLLRRAGHHGRRILVRDVPDPWDYARGRFKVLWGYFAANRRFRQRDIIGEHLAAALSSQAEEEDYYLTLAQFYRPQPADVPVTLFIADDQKTDIAVAWRYLTRSHLDVQPVRAAHFTMLRPESVGELAAALKKHLAAAQARARGPREPAAFVL